MAKLTVDQKTVFGLFSDKNSDFLIPDYQRPYAWGENECLTLWEDICDFALPNFDYSAFDTNSEYYLGPIVTFKNSNGKLEIIDGQQRLTTLLLLLRAFYSKSGKSNDPQSRYTRENIEKCIWKTDEFGQPLSNQLKIDSEVATDNDKGVFLEILETGIVDKNNKSRYAENYRFFQAKVEELSQNLQPCFLPLQARILDKCILLPIDADTQDTALRIFSTLNDRGLPLSDSDIFKAQFYNYFKDKGKKKEFIDKWKDLEELCDDIFANAPNPMDELFTRYMYYERAKQGNAKSTTEALRKFYEKDKYALLKSEKTFDNLIDLADFWKAVYRQDTNRFSNDALKLLFVLNYAPNGMWTYLVSVYYLNGRGNGVWEDETFVQFLNKIIGFIWAYSVIQPGVSALRTPVYPEMKNIVNGKEVTFENNKFSEDSLRALFNSYSFSNGRPITKSMLVWWLYQNEDQDLISLDTQFDIEHIFARKRYENDRRSLTNAGSLECLGNKAILEKRINIRAADYRFADKKKYYEGFTDARERQKYGTVNKELLDLTSLADFTEKEISDRNKEIIDSFISYLRKNDLLR